MISDLTRHGKIQFRWQHFTTSNYFITYTSEQEKQSYLCINSYYFEIDQQLPSFQKKTNTTWFTNILSERNELRKRIRRDDSKEWLQVLWVQKCSRELHSEEWKTKYIRTARVDLCEPVLSSLKNCVALVSNIQNIEHMWIMFLLYFQF